MSLRASAEGRPQRRRNRRRGRRSGHGKNKSRKEHESVNIGGVSLVTTADNAPSVDGTSFDGSEQLERSNHVMMQQTWSRTPTPATPSSVSTQAAHGSLPWSQPSPRSLSPLSPSRHSYSSSSSQDSTNVIHNALKSLCAPSNVTHNALKSLKAPTIVAHDELKVLSAPSIVTQNALELLNTLAHSPPQAYHADYPHPLSVYASPAVNPHSSAATNYAAELQKLSARSKAGNILFENRKDLSAPALMLDPHSAEGCGIPEALWVGLSTLPDVKVPLGAVIPGLRVRRLSLDSGEKGGRAMGPRRSSLPNIYPDKQQPIIIPRVVRLAPVAEGDDDADPDRRDHLGHFERLERLERAKLTHLERLVHLERLEQLQRPQPAPRDQNHPADRLDITARHELGPIGAERSRRPAHIEERMLQDELLHVKERALRDIRETQLKIKEQQLRERQRDIDHDPYNVQIIPRRISHDNCGDHYKLAPTQTDPRLQTTHIGVHPQTTLRAPSPPHGASTTLEFSTGQSIWS